MKKIYTFLAVSAAALFFAQTTTSFEQSEGYVLGDINGQNGWSATEANGEILTNQVVTNEKAKTGFYSLKNAYSAENNPIFMPVIGVEKSFATPLDYKTTTISYDFLANKQGQSDFEFALYSINEAEEVFDTLFAIGFENRSYIYLFPEKNFGGFIYAEPTWEINKWYNMTIKFREDSISCYLDGVEIYNGPNTSKMNINGFNFLHNNYGGDSYIDNIMVNGQDLATYEANLPQTMAVYPNPAKDNISIKSTSKLKNYTIFNTVGQKVLAGTDATNINIQSLKPGVYIVQTTTEDNNILTSKLIKK